MTIQQNSVVPANGVSKRWAAIGERTLWTQASIQARDLCPSDLVLIDNRWREVLDVVTEIEPYEAQYGKFVKDYSTPGYPDTDKPTEEWARIDNWFETAPDSEAILVRLLMWELSTASELKDVWRRYQDTELVTIQVPLAIQAGTPPREEKAA